MWPSDKDLRQGKEFEKKHPWIVGWFFVLGSGVLEVLMDIALFFRDSSNFLVKHKILRPRNNRGQERSLSVHWDEVSSRGHVISNFGGGHYHWNEMGFDMPVSGKEALAAKVLERLQNLRTNRGPGNVQNVRELYRKPTTFFVFVEDGKARFQRWKHVEKEGTITVPLEKEELKDCLEAFEKVLQEPPHPDYFQATRYLDRDGNEVDKATFYARIPGGEPKA